MMGSKLSELLEATRLRDLLSQRPRGLDSPLVAFSEECTVADAFDRMLRECVRSAPVVAAEHAAAAGSPPGADGFPLSAVRGWLDPAIAVDTLLHCEYLQLGRVQQSAGPCSMCSNRIQLAAQLCPASWSAHRRHILS